MGAMRHRARRPRGLLRRDWEPNGSRQRLVMQVRGRSPILVAFFVEQLQMPNRLSRRLFLSHGGALVAALAWPLSVSAAPSQADLSASPVPRADQPIIRIDVTGGLLPVTVAYSTLPDFVLYPDGHVITQGPICRIFASLG